MREYEIVDTNADNIGGCGICRYKSGKNEGRRRKLDWLKKRYAEGLRFKVLRSREFGDIGMIEYAPGSHAWRPVEAEGYLVIHCLMVNSKHKGKGLGLSCWIVVSGTRRRASAEGSQLSPVQTASWPEAICSSRRVLSRWRSALPTSCSSRSSRREPLILVSSSTGSEY